MSVVNFDCRIRWSMLAKKEFGELEVERWKGSVRVRGFL